MLVPDRMPHLRRTTRIRKRFPGVATFNIVGPGNPAGRKGRVSNNIEDGTLRRTRLVSESASRELPPSTLLAREILPVGRTVCPTILKMARSAARLVSESASRELPPSTLLAREILPVGRTVCPTILKMARSAARDSFPHALPTGTLERTSGSGVLRWQFRIPNSEFYLWSFLISVTCWVWRTLMRVPAG